MEKKKNVETVLKPGDNDLSVSEIDRILDFEIHPTSSRVW